MRIYQTILTQLASKKMQIESELERLVNVNNTTSSNMNVYEQTNLIINELEKLVLIEQSISKWINLNPNKSEENPPT